MKKLERIINIIDFIFVPCFFLIFYILSFKNFDSIDKDIFLYFMLMMSLFFMKCNMISLTKLENKIEIINYDLNYHKHKIK